MEHTPGPWYAAGYDDGAFEVRNGPWPHGFIIASRNGYADWKRAAESQANAYLIAAAPCLLSALSDLLELHEDEPDRPAVAVARAAIAKATAKGK